MLCLTHIQWQYCYLLFYFCTNPMDMWFSSFDYGCFICWVITCNLERPSPRRGFHLLVCNCILNIWCMECNPISSQAFVASSICQTQLWRFLHDTHSGNWFVEHDENDKTKYRISRKRVSHRLMHKHVWQKTTRNFISLGEVY